jgi:hypothetical protein
MLMIITDKPQPGGGLMAIGTAPNSAEQNSVRTNVASVDGAERVDAEYLLQTGSPVMQLQTIKCKVTLPTLASLESQHWRVATS